MESRDLRELLWAASRETVPPGNSVVLRLLPALLGPSSALLLAGGRLYSNPGFGNSGVQKSQSAVLLPLEDPARPGGKAGTETEGRVCHRFSEACPRHQAHGGERAGLWVPFGDEALMSG